jgi:hypothetical protein
MTTPHTANAIQNMTSLESSSRTSAPLAIQAITPKPTAPKNANPVTRHPALNLSSMTISYRTTQPIFNSWRNWQPVQSRTEFRFCAILAGFLRRFAPAWLEFNEGATAQLWRKRMSSGERKTGLKNLREEIALVEAEIKTIEDCRDNDRGYVSSRLVHLEKRLTALTFSLPKSPSAHYDHLSAALRVACRGTMLSDAELALKSGVSQRHISAFLRGGGLSLRSAGLLAHYLGLELRHARRGRSRR